MAADTTSTDNDQPRQLYDELAERAVIGAILLSGGHEIANIAPMLLPDDFEIEQPREVYRLMRTLWEQRIPPDVATLGGRMIDAGLHHFGDLPLDFLAATLLEVQIPSHARFYAQRVLDLADRRRVMDSLVAREKAAGNLNTNIDALIAETATSLSSARRTQPNGRYSFIGDLDDDALFNPLPRLEIGGCFAPVDNLTGGFERGQMVTVAARPSVGKSAIVIQWLYAIATRRQCPVGFISLEMGKRDVRNRIIAIGANVNLHDLRRGIRPDAHAVERILLVGDQLAALPFVIDDDPDTELKSVLGRARAMANEQRCAAIAIDYLQLMRVKETDSRVDEVERISGAMKQLARELQIPVIVLAQLNRGVELRPDAEPRLSDLKNSGAIEQDSDLVILIHRVNEEGKVKVIVGKNRNGPTGWVDMQFVRETAAFAATGGTR